MLEADVEHQSLMRPGQHEAQVRQLACQVALDDLLGTVPGISQRSTEPCDLLRGDGPRSEDIVRHAAATADAHRLS